MWLRSTAVGMCIERVMPLAITVWIYVDLILDVVQANKYYELGDGIKECEQYSPTGNDNERSYEISKGYFYCSITTFVMPPFLITVFAYVMYGRYGSFGGSDRKSLHWYKEKMVKQPAVVRGLLFVFVVLLWLLLIMVQPFHMILL